MNNFHIAKESLIYIIILAVITAISYFIFYSAGERFVLKKFGSYIEIIIPASATIHVKPGDKVRGAKTIIGVIS